MRRLRLEREDWHWCSAVQLGWSLPGLSYPLPEDPGASGDLRRFKRAPFIFFFWLSLSQQQLFWNSADVNNYRAKRSWRGGNRGGLAEFHLQSFGINWHTGKSRDVFLLNKWEKTPFTSLQHHSPQTLAQSEQHRWAPRPPNKNSQSAVSPHMGDCVNQRGKRTQDFKLRMSQTEKYSVCGKRLRFHESRSDDFPTWSNCKFFFCLDENLIKGTEKKSPASRESERSEKGMV